MEPNETASRAAYVPPTSAESCPLISCYSEQSPAGDGGGAMNEVRRGQRYRCGTYHDLVIGIEPDQRFRSGFRVDYTIERADGSHAGSGHADLDEFRASRDRASRFTPDADEARRLMVNESQRAERLAQRITAARRALRSGQSSELVLAILDGKAERPDV